MGVVVEGAWHVALLLVGTRVHRRVVEVVVLPLDLLQLARVLDRGFLWWWYLGEGWCWSVQYSC